MQTSLLQMLHPTAQTTSRSSTASSSAATSATTSSSTDPGSELSTEFMQLLTAQLKNQSPLDPVDPNQFITQLATIDSLGALTSIQSLMQTLVNDVGGTTSSASGASANAGANSISSPSFNSVSH